MSELTPSIPTTTSEQARPTKTRKPKKQDHPVKEPATIAEFAAAWFHVFEANTKGRNPCYYHSCCFAFSSDHLRNDLGHVAFPESISWRTFRKNHKVTDVLSFEKALEKISSGLPNSYMRCPSYNKPHHNFIEEIREIKKKNCPTLQDQVFDLDDEVRDLQADQTEMAKEIERLNHKSQSQEARLNKLEYFLKVQGIDPNALVEGQTPATSILLQKHAPENLEWPDYLPSYPTPSIFHPLFSQVKQKVGEFRSDSEPEVARLLEEESPEELNRLLQAGLMKPKRVKIAKPIRPARPSSPKISWLQGLCDPNPACFTAPQPDEDAN